MTLLKPSLLALAIVSASLAHAQAVFTAGEGVLSLPVLELDSATRYAVELEMTKASPMEFGVTSANFQQDGTASAWLDSSFGNLLRIPDLSVIGLGGQHQSYAALLQSSDSLLSWSLSGATPRVSTEQRLNSEILGTYDSGLFDSGAAEIVAFDPASKRMFVSNAANASVDIISLNDAAAPVLLSTIDISSLGASANSVAVRDGILAIAIEALDKQSPGVVAFYDTAGSFLNSVMVGALPDMLTFSPDGTKVVVACEGEPDADYTVDPEGSVAILDISTGVMNATVILADFRDFEPQTEALKAQGLRVFGPNASLAQDLEPEYVTINAESTKAYVTLQENNALAEVDLVNGVVTRILPLGVKDYSLPGNELDASDKDKVLNLKNYPVLGLYLPDSIASIEVEGETYLLTANEGDSRDYAGFSEEVRVADVTLDPVAFPDAASLQDSKALGRLKITTTLGDTDGDGDYDQLYSYGARSFSVWDSHGQLKWDSGNAIATLTAAELGEHFNVNDSRSDDKGAEPESITTGQVGTTLYAFVGLERTSGIVVYDMSNPLAPVYVQYLHNRDWSKDEGETGAGDIGPEGLHFVSAAQSPTGKALLLVANEVSGTTTIYQLQPL